MDTDHHLYRTGTFGVMMQNITFAVTTPIYF